MTAAQFGLEKLLRLCDGGAIYGTKFKSLKAVEWNCERSSRVLSPCVYVVSVREFSVFLTSQMTCECTGSP